MFWNEKNERSVRPGIALVWGVIMMLIGLASLWAFVASPSEKSEPTPISMAEAHEHLDEWVAVTDVRFDCSQLFDFEPSSSEVPRTTYVVATSTDGSVVALARYVGGIDCRPVPAGSIWGTFRPLVGSGPLGYMREQGLTFPETDKTILELDTSTEPEERWVTLLMGVIFLVGGIRASRSGLRRRQSSSRNARAT